MLNSYLYINYQTISLDWLSKGETRKHSDLFHTARTIAILCIKRTKCDLCEKIIIFGNWDLKMFVCICICLLESLKEFPRVKPTCLLAVCCLCNVWIISLNKYSANSLRSIVFSSCVYGLVSLLDCSLGQVSEREREREREWERERERERERESAWGRICCFTAL